MPAKIPEILEFNVCGRVSLYICVCVGGCIGFVCVVSSYFSALLSAVLCRCRQFVPAPIAAQARQREREEEKESERESGKERVSNEGASDGGLNINQSSKLRASDRHTKSVAALLLQVGVVL